MHIYMYVYVCIFICMRAQICISECSKNIPKMLITQIKKIIMEYGKQVARISAAIDNIYNIIYTYVEIYVYIVEVRMYTY